MIFLTSGRKKQITNSYGNLFSRSNENHPKFGTNKATYGIAVEHNTIVIPISRRTEVRLEDNTQYFFYPTNINDIHYKL